MVCYEIERSSQGDQDHPNDVARPHQVGTFSRRAIGANSYLLFFAFLAAFFTVTRESLQTATKENALSRATGAEVVLT